MRAIAFFDESMEASNGGGGTTKVCVDGKVHITLSYSWMDNYDSVFYGDLQPCDGTCQKELPPEAEELVKRFLASDGKNRGEFRKRD